MGCWGGWLAGWVGGRRVGLRGRLLGDGWLSLWFIFFLRMELCPTSSPVLILPAPPPPLPPRPPPTHTPAAECPATGTLFNLKDGSIESWYPNNFVLRMLTPASTCRKLEIYPVHLGQDAISVDISGGWRAGRGLCAFQHGSPSESLPGSRSRRAGVLFPLKPRAHPLDRSMPWSLFVPQAAFPAAAPPPAAAPTPPWRTTTSMGWSPRCMLTAARRRQVRGNLAG